MNAIERAERISQAAQMHMKGYPITQISKDMGVSTDTVRQWIREYDEWVSDKVAQNPDFLEQHLENTIKFEDQLQVLMKETWDVVELANKAGAMSTKLQALKLAKDLTEAKARLFQLMAPRMDKGYMERMKKLERVKEVLFKIISEVVSGCPRCSELTARRIDEIQRLIPGVPALEDGIVEGEIVE